MKQGKDFVVYPLVSIILFVVGALLPIGMNGLTIATFPLVVLAYRQGLQRAFVSILVTSILESCILWFLLKNNANYSITDQSLAIHLLVYTNVVTLSAGHGIFAKNVHKTLNNKRLINVFVNVATASLLVGAAQTLSLYSLQNYVDVTYSVIAIVLPCAGIMGIAYVQPKQILTKRSQFLTSKERSKLLND